MAFRIKAKGIDGKAQSSQKKIVGEIRKSQSINTYGPGALVDFPRMSGIIDGIDNWESTLGKFNFEKMVVHERNLERILGKNYFIQPQMMDERNYVNGIMTERFPEFYYCPECGALDKYFRIEKKANNSTKYNSDVFCGICSQTKGRNVKLIPSRFIVSCKCGHLNDFPYEWWAHKRTGKCEKPKLKLEISRKTNSLEGMVVRCQCGAHETLEGIMDKGALYQRKCFGEMPWLGKKEDHRGWFSDISDDFCEEELRVLQRSANNVYYPCTVSALTIPPYSSRIQKILADDVSVLTTYMNMDNEELKNSNLHYYYDVHKNRLGCDYEQFLNEIGYALGIEETTCRSITELMQGEYDALCDEDCADPDFLTIGMEVPIEFERYFDQIKIVGRLREVQVLQGFKRISQEEGIMAPISRKNLEWLPANELFGEGIFIKYNEEKIKEWEKNNSKRYETLVNRAKNSFFVKDKISSESLRYVLLHTMAHLFIRELTMRCGYTAASIKEKIYSSSDINKPMCGILVYTASADSDGSLGGLARQGVTDKIRETMFSMLENASWCSNDPICIDTKSQGVASLNYAACHTCALLPETSCECGNVLLDRGALIGTSDNQKSGFFSELFE